MKSGILAILSTSILCGCLRSEAAPEPSPVQEGTGALTVRSEPGGATVRVNKHDRTWVTPCDIPESFLRRGTQDVVLTLEGYEPLYRTVATDRKKPALLEVKLTPRSGAVSLEGAVPGALVLLLRVPEGVKDAGTLIRLWSENEATLLKALEGLADDEAPLAANRLRELATSPLEKVAAAAKKTAEKAGNAQGGAEAAFRAIADIHGSAKFARVPVGGTVHLLATRPGSPDFAMAGLKADWRAPVVLRVPAPAVARPADPARPPAAKVSEAVPGPPSQVRVKTSGGVVRVTAGGKVLAELPAKADEALTLTIPAGRVTIETLDPKSGAVLHSVELLADAGGAVHPPRESERIGWVQLVHRVYGVFVKLEPGLELVPGEEVVVYRDGAEHARGRILQVCAEDETYPHGAAQVTRDVATLREGDEVRRFR